MNVFPLLQNSLLFHFVIIHETFIGWIWRLDSVEGLFQILDYF